jgi:hypothetical protein
VKHLKVLYKDHDDDTFSLALIQQTHTGTEFGNYAPSKAYGTIGFMHGDVCLVAGSGTIRIDDSITPWGNIPTKHLIVWVLFRDEYIASKLPSFNPNRYTSKYWPRVKAAIEAYNEFYKEYV